MNRNLLIAVMVLLLVFFTQSQLRAEHPTKEISGILKDVIVNYNGSAFPGHTAFCLEKQMHVFADVPSDIVFEKGKMCVIRYTSSPEFREGGDGWNHFVSIECRSDVQVSGSNLKK